MIDFAIFHLSLASIQHFKLFLKANSLRFCLSACNKRTNKWLCLYNLHQLSTLFISSFKPGQFVNWGFVAIIVWLIVFVVFVLDLRHWLISYLINFLLIKYLIDRLFFKWGGIFTGELIKFLLLELLIVLLNHSLKSWHCWRRSLTVLITGQLIWLVIILILIVDRIFIINALFNMFRWLFSDAAFCYHLFSSVRWQNCFSLGGFWHNNRCVLPFCFSNWFFKNPFFFKHFFLKTLINIWILDRLINFASRLSSRLIETSNVACRQRVMRVA